jgi:Asp-tRNA(Asn)/Glu-tRNA(Gln) amidotransferase A subunit family amidase
MMVPTVAGAATREIAHGKYRGLLHGVPIGVKDLCYTKGVRTMGGTAALKDFVPHYAAGPVRDLSRR